MTDAELLEQHRRGSKEAFAELARRHVDWVFCVARRRVRDVHLAEDVTQASFVVLVQKPPRLKAGQSLSAWLFGVVNFISLRAIRAEQRRRTRETEAAKMRETNQTDEWGQLTPELDALVGRLKYTDRQPLLLRFYEQKSFSQVALEMGISEEAARKRVSRATEQLREMLRGRGITMPATALGTLLLAELTKPASAALAVGITTSPLSVNASVMGLAKAATSMILWAQVKAAALIGVAAVCVFSGIALVATTMAQPGPAQAGPAVAPPPATRPATQVNVDPKTPGEMIRVKGLVLDPSGKPASNARITVPPPSNWDDRLNIKPVAETKSGADGRFLIEYRKSDVAPFTLGGGQSGLDAWQRTSIVASADGFGMAWEKWNRTDSNGDVVLRLLPDDVPIDGRILSADGKPAPGVAIVVAECSPFLSEKESQELFQNDPEASYQRWLPLHSAGRVEPIFTDLDGRFHLAGIGKDRKISLQLHGPNVGYARIEVATRIMEPQSRLVPQGTGVNVEFTTYGAKFDFKAAGGTSVEGTVVDAANGNPLPGVIVQSLQFAGKFQGMDPQGLIRSVTDAQGHYHLDGFPKGAGNEIIAVPNDDQPYFMREAKVQDEPGALPITLDLELHRGVWITGKVTDLVTGEPVPARMRYTTFANNAHTFNLPEFHRNRGSAMLDGYQGRYETKPGGTYRVVAAPGPALVWVEFPPEKYRKGIGADQIEIFKKRNYIFDLYQPPPFAQGLSAIKQIDVPENANEVPLDFGLDPGQNIHVNVIDPDGKPTTRSVFVRGETAENYFGWYGRIIQGDSFDALSFGPGESRAIFVLDSQRKLGKVVLAKFDDPPNHKLTIQLAPLAKVTGRCVDLQGKPLADLPLEPGTMGKGAPGAKTDADGKFEIWLIPDGEYGIGISLGPYAATGVATHLSAAPGSVQDLGEIQLRRRINN